MVTEWKKCGLVSLQTLVIVMVHKGEKNTTKTNEGKSKGKETFDEAKGDKHIGQPEFHALLH